MLAGVSVLTLATVVGCGTAKKEAPDQTSTPSSTPSSSASPAPAPTETQKDLTPGGPNSFTPPASANPAPTVPPGHRHHG